MRYFHPESAFLSRLIKILKKSNKNLAEELLNNTVRRDGDFEELRFSGSATGPENSDISSR